MNGEKKYYRIGEVSEILGIKPHVLRYWESEFPEIKPIKSRSNHRMYKRVDLDILKQVKKLLYEEGYTIKGAKSKIKELSAERSREDIERIIPSIKNIVKSLRELETILSKGEDI